MSESIHAELENEIKKAELHESMKQALIRLLDDPQIQQKIVKMVQKRFAALTAEV